MLIRSDTFRYLRLVVYYVHIVLLIDNMCILYTNIDLKLRNK